MRQIGTILTEVETSVTVSLTKSVVVVGTTSVVVVGCSYLRKQVSIQSPRYSWTHGYVLQLLCKGSTL